MRFEITVSSRQKKKEMENKNLEGNNPLQSPQTGKVCLDTTHLSCKRVGIRALEEFLSWRYDRSLLRLSYFFVLFVLQFYLMLVIIQK